MHLILLDADFARISQPITDYNTLMWIERWDSDGEFTLTLPARYFLTAKSASYIYSQALDAVAAVGNVTYRNDELTASGSTLESILSGRVIEEEQILSGTYKSVIETVMTRYALTGDRAIPKLTISVPDDFIDPYDGVIEEGTYLNDWLREALNAIGASYKITYDWFTDTLTFTLRKGLDRTQTQDINPWATFSTAFGSVQDIEYDKNTRDYKNFAYVIGAYNDTRIVEIIDETNGNPRKETVIKPSITSNEEITSEEQYRSLLRQRGTEALAEYKTAETFNCGIDTNSALVYGVNYNLGDLCDVVIDAVDDYGGHTKRKTMWTTRITSVEHTYKPDGNIIVPGFGEDVLNLRKYIQREARR